MKWFQSFKIQQIIDSIFFTSEGIIMSVILKKIMFSYKQIWVWLSKKQKKQFYLVLFLTIISSFNEAISVGMLLPFLSVLLDVNMLLENKYAIIFMDLVSFNDFENITLYITVVFLCSVFLSGVLKIVLIHTNLRLGQTIAHDMSCYIYKNNLYMDYEESIKRNSSEVISLIKSKSVILTNLFFLQINQFLSSFAICLVILILLFTINHKIAASCFFVFGIFYLLITFFVRLRMSVYSTTLSELDPKTIKLLNEGLGEKKEIILNNAYLYYENLFKYVDAIFKRISTNIQIMAVLPKVFIETFSLIILAFVAYIISLKVSSFISIIPILGVFVLAAQKLLPQFQYMYAAWVQICGSLVSVDDVIKELKIKKYIGQQNIERNFKFESHIKFVNVGYSYFKNEKMVLENIDIKINKGDKVGLIGPTGSGKSTFLDVFMGLLKPQKGDIIIDNKNFLKNDENNWQSNISHVPQSIFLADTSILENIAIGTPLEKIDKKLALKAAKKAQIHTVIESWDEGYNTIVGENGINLSGGQRQRIGLARSFYKQKPIIVFDEATSALDQKTEKKVVEEIFKSCDQNNETFIMCSHRLEILENCDYIIEIDNGKISHKIKLKDFKLRK